MPPLETIDLHQTAVLWPAVGIDDDGEVIIGEPVEIPVRWELRRMESLDHMGATIALDAAVVVDREVADLSILWLGTLEEWYGSGSAGAGVGLHQMKTYRKTPDIKNRSRRRTLGLQRFRDRLPGH